MFGIHLRQYIKVPKLGIINIIGLVGVWYYLYYYTYNYSNDIISFIVYSMAPVRYLFFLYIFLAHEFFSMDKRAALEEVIDSVHHGRRRCEWAKFFVFLCSIGCEAGMVYAYYLKHLEQLHCATNETKLYFAAVVLIYHFGVCLLAVGIGWGTTFFKNRISGYAAIIFLSYLFTPNLIVILKRISWDTEFYNKIAELFCIYERDYGATSNCYYLLSVEAVEVQRLCVWLLLCICLIGWKLWKHKGWVVIPAVLMFLVFSLFWQPTSAVYADMGVSGHDAWSHDMLYYTYRKNYQENIENAQGQAFRVNTYKMELGRDRILTAKVEMELDTSALDKYIFTLYHGYKIQKILNMNGEELQYEQKEDLVTVYSAGNMKKVCFYYQGCCKNYYTTSQGMYLPAYFPYYPMAGAREVYLDIKSEKNEYLHLYEGYNLECPEYEAAFDITVSGKQTVYCNLEEKEKNHFYGKSNGVTLLSGYFIKTEKIGDCTMVYSYMDENVWSVEAEEKKDIEGWLKKNKELKGQTIFISPRGNYESHAIVKEHLIIEDISLLKEVYERYQNTGYLYENLEEEE